MEEVGGRVADGKRRWKGTKRRFDIVNQSKVSE